MIPTEDASARKREIEEKLKQVNLEKNKERKTTGNVLIRLFIYLNLINKHSGLYTHYPHYVAFYSCISSSAALFIC